MTCVRATETSGIIPAAAGGSFDPVPISGPWGDTSIIIGTTGLPARDSGLGCKKIISPVDPVMRGSDNSIPGNLHLKN